MSPFSAQEFLRFKLLFLLFKSLPVCFTQQGKFILQNSKLFKSFWSLLEISQKKTEKEKEKEKEKHRKAPGNPFSPAGEVAHDPSLLPLEPVRPSLLFSR
jgi:hypothetical protein